MVEEKFITKIQGKEFITHEGLLDEFHKNGGKEIFSEMVVREDYAGAMFRATVKGEKGIFSAHGDACGENVSKGIAPHFIRMAETRAINRALRLYNNIGMCSSEELGESVAGTMGEDIPIPHANTCYQCGDDNVPSNVRDYSIRNLGKVVCFKCQQKTK